MIRKTRSVSSKSLFLSEKCRSSSEASAQLKTTSGLPANRNALSPKLWRARFWASRRARRIGGCLYRCLQAFIGPRAIYLVTYWSSSSMKSLLQWLRARGELISEHTLLGYLPTRVRIVDAEHRPVNAVQVGKQFLHGVEVITNLYPGTVEGEILSDLGSTNQLRFVHESRAGKGFGA